MKKYNYIVVGCGIYGVTIAERLRAHGKSVLVIEKRNHIGGNCYSYEFEDTNITVHKYGTHIFHVNNKVIWDYVNKFTDFNRYQHRVLTTYKNRVYSMPINLGTINMFYNSNIRPKDVEPLITKQKKNIKNPRNLEEKAISLIGKDLYDAFIKGYTAKQWGCDPKELPPEIITRLPVRTSYHDSYFDDYYQGLPLLGYTEIFKNMLKEIPVELNVDFFDKREYWLKHCDHLIFTGPLDQFYEYVYGRLQWRSVKFELKCLSQDDYQGTSVMNFADLDIPYTRIHEPRHLHRERQYKLKKTVIIREYPVVLDKDPYYPVNSAKDIVLLAKYKELAEKEKQVVFGGRLAEYKYYDMHHAIEAAFKEFKNLMNCKKT